MSGWTPSCGHQSLSCELRARGSCRPAMSSDAASSAISTTAQTQLPLILTQTRLDRLVRQP